MSLIISFPISYWILCLFIISINIFMHVLFDSKFESLFTKELFLVSYICCKYFPFCSLYVIFYIMNIFQIVKNLSLLLIMVSKFYIVVLKAFSVTFIKRRKKLFSIFFYYICFIFAFNSLIQNIFYAYDVRQQLTFCFLKQIPTCTKTIY